MQRPSDVIAVLMGAVLLGACGVQEQGYVDVNSFDQALDSQNGVSLNGVSLNGVSLNGTSVSGFVLGHSRLGGHGIASVSLSRGALVVAMGSGAQRAGAALQGTQITADLGSAGQVSLRIDDVEAGLDADQDYELYGISYQNQFGGWEPLCGYGAAGQPIRAMVLSGYWDMERAGEPGGGAKVNDPSQFTLACRGTTAAKCVMMGYKPWRTDESLDDYHQACVRMIRADYCGDGTSWTVNGRSIDLYDALGINRDTSDWTFEAEWTAAGARCVKERRVRWSNRAAPACLDSINQQRDCGATEHFAAGTLLMQEFQQVLYQ